MTTLPNSEQQTANSKQPQNPSLRTNAHVRVIRARRACTHHSPHMRKCKWKSMRICMRMHMYMCTQSCIRRGPIMSINAPMVPCTRAPCTHAPCTHVPISQMNARPRADLAGSCPHTHTCTRARAHTHMHVHHVYVHTGAHPHRAPACVHMGHRRTSVHMGHMHTSMHKGTDIQACTWGTDLQACT